MCVSSANYVINEWLDRDFDRFHPTKSRRASVQRELRGDIVVLEWAAFIVAALACAVLDSRTMYFIATVFVLQGILYNVAPLRTKDVPFLDVISESINNPLRLVIGWVMIDPTTLPPGSLILMYWSGGAFLMAAKRLSEFREIGAACGKELLARYRASFAFYSEISLTISCFVYALLAVFFLAVFLIKYRIEYLLTVPVVIALFAYYMIMAMTPGSAAQKPEKLFRERGLVMLVVLLAGNIPAGNVRRRADVRCARRATLHRHPMISDRAAGTFDWAGVRLVAFDVDGTLYSQPRLRLRIAREMLIDAVIRQSLEAVTIVRAYRQIRERMAEREVADYEGTHSLKQRVPRGGCRNGARNCR